MIPLFLAASPSLNILFYLLKESGWMGNGGPHSLFNVLVQSFHQVQMVGQSNIMVFDIEKREKLLPLAC